jgi:hypothetical protein
VHNVARLDGAVPHSHALARVALCQAPSADSIT